MFNPIDSAINHIAKGTVLLNSVSFECPHEQAIAHLGWQWQSSINYNRLIPQIGNEHLSGEALLMSYGLGEVKAWHKGSGDAHEIAVSLAHDSIHALFNLGADYADEAMVIHLLGEMRDGRLVVINQAFTDKLVQLNIESGDI